jgi:hypothetical protein
MVGIIELMDNKSAYFIVPKFYILHSKLDFNLQSMAQKPQDFAQLQVTVQNTPTFAFIAFSVASISIPMFTNLPI